MRLLPLVPRAPAWERTCLGSFASSAPAARSARATRRTAAKVTRHRAIHAPRNNANALATPQRVMSAKIAANDVENAKKRAEEELKYASISSELKSASVSLARNAIIQNYFFDREKTDGSKEKEQ